MATNYAKASYTEVIDLQTTNGSTSVIGIHTPVGNAPFTRLKGFFEQFRRYRYRGISSLVMINAAQLPIDPLGLTGVVGTTDLMDPRDTLNPILFKGCHGDNLSHILNTIYSADEYASGPVAHNVSTEGRNVSDSASESIVPNTIDSDTYYKQLTDTSWRKFGIQSGVKLKGLRPLVHKMAMSTPMLPNSIVPAEGQIMTGMASADTPGEVSSLTPVTRSTDNSYSGVPFSGMHQVNDFNTTQYNRLMFNQEFTNGMQQLGWLPTTMPVNANAGAISLGAPAVTMLPKLFMGVLVLPPSYNVEQFFRCVIRHEFEFKDFTTSISGMEIVSSPAPSTCYFNWIDYSVDSAKTLGSVPYDNGTTLDIIAGNSNVVSDGVS